MIDITVESDTIIIENKEYTSLDYERLDFDSSTVIDVLKDVIDKCFYSGESVTLWKVVGTEKHLIKEWP